MERHLERNLQIPCTERSTQSSCNHNCKSLEYYLRLYKEHIYTNHHSPTHPLSEKASELGWLMHSFLSVKNKTHTIAKSLKLYTVQRSKVILQPFYRWDLKSWCSKHRID